jgi:hypothetical protein
MPRRRLVPLGDIHAYVSREGQPSPTINLDERAREILGTGKRRAAE